MSAEAAALVRTFRVGKRRVTITLPRVCPGRVACIAIEWSPSAPTRLSCRERAQYRRGRDAALLELARELGIDVLVAEI